MPLIDATEAEELVTLEEAKRHLRITAGVFDDELLQSLSAARQNCESWMARTLSAPRIRTWSMCSWWSGQLKLPYPPVIIDGDHEVVVKYFDADDVDQTLPAASYHVVQSTEGHSYLEWVNDATQPNIATRPDAVRVEFPSGYLILPNKYKLAILMELTRLWGDAKGRDLEYADRCATSLKNSLDSGTYT